MCDNSTVVACVNKLGDRIRLPLRVDRATSLLDRSPQCAPGSEVPPGTIERPSGPPQPPEPSAGCRVVPPQAVFKDAFRHPWKDLDVYPFPPFHLVERVVARVRETPNLSMTLVVPLWPEKTWFADLLLLLSQPPPELPPWDHLLRQPHFNRFYGGAHALNLHSWRLSSVSSESQDFRDELRASCPVASENPLHACTSHNGSLSVVGVVEGALL